MELSIYYGFLAALLLLVAASTGLRSAFGGSRYDIAQDVIYGMLGLAALLSALLIGLPWIQAHGPALAHLW